MNETIFEQVEAFASVLKLDLSAEEFAQFAEDQELSEAGMEAVVNSGNRATSARTFSHTFTAKQPHCHGGQPQGKFASIMVFAHEAV